MFNRASASIVIAAALGTAAELVAQVPVPPDAELFLRRRTGRDAVVAGRPIGVADPSPAEALFAITRGPGGEQMVGAFIRVAPGTEAALRGLGVEIGARTPGWISARVPISRLGEVAATSGVRGIELARRATIHVDSSLIDIGVAGLRERTTGDHFRGSTGRGAIVGIVDTGIDFLHPDFIEDGNLGRSRVVYLWDQTGSGNGPGPVGSSSFTYGRECKREDMTASGCSSRDTEGHGTHVAGTAAGDGSGARRGSSNYAYAGVAPGAELIVVKTDLSFTGIVDGVDYIFRRAAELGRPAVVNLSLGSQLGPHDGYEASSLMIDALTGPGRIVVASAGNYGRNLRDLTEPEETPDPSVHADVTPAVGAAATIGFTLVPYLPRSGPGNDLILLQAYFDSTDVFAVTIERPNGTRVELAAPAKTVASSAAGGGVYGYMGSIAGDSIIGDLEFGSFAPTSPSHTLELFIGEWFTGFGPPAAGEWKVTFRRVSGTGSGVVDAYLPFDFTGGGATFTTGASNRRLIGPPGDARSVITVAAYSTRATWLGFDEIEDRLRSWRLVPSVQTGGLLRFSSPGPSRDGRRKPDISAPGRNLSTLSMSSSFPRPLIDGDSAHALLEGTSMAAPHVTGTVALLLSEKPTLTPVEARAALMSSARRDAFTESQATGDVPAPDGSNGSWGAGKLSVPGALAAVVEIAGHALVAIGETDSTGSTSRAGTVIELQSFRVGATDAESLSVRRVAAAVTGRDAAFRLGIVLDADRDGVAGEGEPVIATSPPGALAGSGTFATMIPQGGLVVPRGGTVDLIVVGVLSGATPNKTTFTASLDNALSTTVGLTSGEEISFAGTPGLGRTVTTTLLQAGEPYNLSQNPVRSTPLIINLGEDPRATAIEIFDFGGRLVRRISVAPADGSVRWDLTREDGRPVANGAYVLLIHFPTGPVRRQLFVVR